MGTGPIATGEWGKAALDVVDAVPQGRQWKGIPKVGREVVVARHGGYEIFRRAE